MKRLSKTGIEYLDYVWNFASGCENNERGICPINPCWARETTKHFPRNYPQGFKPTIYPEALLSPQKLKKPARIGVCFMGDLFGDWVNPDEWVSLSSMGLFDTIDVNTGRENGIALKWAILDVIEKCPQHTFVFLTKCGWNLEKWSPFPDNCEVGISAWDTLSFVAAYIHLIDVQAQVKFISLEPFLEWDPWDPRTTIPLIEQAHKAGVSWLIIGAYTGTKAQMLAEQKKYPDLTLRQYDRKWSLQPPVEWVESIIMAADKAGIPVFLKNNLKPLIGMGLTPKSYYTGTLRQEYPSPTPSRTEVI